MQNEYDFVIYTDGAYSSSRNQGGIGIVFSRDGKTIIKEYNKPFTKDANSARMELMAAAVALESVKVPSNILLITDYENLRGGITGEKQKHSNLSIWKRIEDAIKFHKSVKADWTKGHADNPMNIRADELAVQASQMIILK